MERLCDGMLMWPHEMNVCLSCKAKASSYCSIEWSTSGEATIPKNEVQRDTFLAVIDYISTTIPFQQ